MFRKLPHLDFHFQNLSEHSSAPEGALLQKIDRSSQSLVCSYLLGENFHLAILELESSIEILPRPLSGDYAVSGQWIVYLSQNFQLIVHDLALQKSTMIAPSPVDWNISGDGSKVLFREAGTTKVFDLNTGEIVASYEGRYLTCDSFNIVDLELGDALAIATNLDPLLSYQITVWGPSGNFVIFQSLHGSVIVWRQLNGQVTTKQLSNRWFVGYFLINLQTYLCFRCGCDMETHRVSENDWVIEFSENSKQQVQHFLVSAGDGVKIPLTLISSESTPIRSALVTVHGGFGVSLRPFSSKPATEKLHLGFAHVRGGGEKGITWANAGRGNNKFTSLADLISCLEELRKMGYDEIFLSGASHGGWLSILVGLHRPDLVNKIIAVSPIVDLASYAETPLGNKHRREFPDDISRLDPTQIIAKTDSSPGPSLLIFGGMQDNIVSNQDYEGFVLKWNAKLGTANLYMHQGGHYSPSTLELEKLEAIRQSFLEENLQKQHE